MAMLMLMRTQRHQRRRRRRTTQRHVHCDAERKYAARMKDERCDGIKLELGSGGKPVLNGRSSGSGSSSSSSRRRRKTECDVRVRSSVGVDPTPVSSSHADEQGGEDTLVAFEVGREEKDDEVAARQLTRPWRHLTVWRHFRARCLGWTPSLAVFRVPSVKCPPWRSLSAALSC